MIKEQHINKYFPFYIYTISLCLTLTTLYQAREYGLLPMPQRGMDQLNFLIHAKKLIHGILPGYGYKLCSGYTILLAFLSFISHGNIIIMRIIQAMLSSLIPVFIFKLSRQMRYNFLPSQAVALLYCLYAPAILISIAFLRASTLSLFFILFVYLLLKGFYSKKSSLFALAGCCAAITVLYRENFIPVIFTPILMLFFKDIRQHISRKQIISYFGVIFIIVGSIILYNYIRFSSPEIIPGNFKHIFKFYYGEKVISNTSKLTGSIIQRSGRQFLDFLSSYEKPNSLSVYAHQALIPIMKSLILPFNLILALAIVGSAYMIKKKENLFVTGVSVGYILTIIYFTMFYRFRIPVVPLLFVLSAGFFQFFQTKYMQKKKILLGIFFIVFFSYLTYTPASKLTSLSEKRAVISILIDIGNLNYAEDLIDNTLLKEKLPAQSLIFKLINKYYQLNDITNVNRLLQKYKITLHKKIKKKENILKLNE